jgi:hypothetical protein
VKWSLLLLLACSGDDPNKSGPGDLGDFAPFTWEALETYTAGAGSMPTQPDGRNLFLVHLYLMEDGEFTLFYEEGEGESDDSGWSISTYTDTQRRLEGKARVSGGQLLVGDLLSCVSLSFNGEEALSCELEREIETGEAVGSSFTLAPDTFGPSHPDDSQWGGYE